MTSLHLRDLDGLPVGPDDRFALHERAAAGSSFASDVRHGLTAKPKTLQPQYFYDDLGSALFEAICHLPEYYPTRCETEILTEAGDAIADAFGPCSRLVELGSGSARKTRLLIERILERQDELEYIPVDIDPGVLRASARDLLSEFPGLRVTAVAGDFRNPGRTLANLLPPARRGERTVMLFLGSSIGNLDEAAAIDLLASARGVLASRDAFFLGADLRKSRDILEPAYDDALGVTAAFNLNLLARINRQLGGHFDLGSFAHRALYDQQLGRIEMHLVSRGAQTVRIDAINIEIAFTEGETIHTESSYKYDGETLARLAAASGFAISQQWTDAKGWFTDVLLT
ncbi:MAG TPA: L-histidine N(alpha)-methyltransferase [Thermoanaerobaculia bacterium]|nr:L-histidine N(alpha)-methyltransferase [Thermoanaerobaculia bacterium]